MFKVTSFLILIILLLTSSQMIGCGQEIIEEVTPIEVTPEEVEEQRDWIEVISFKGSSGWRETEPFTIKGNALKISHEVKGKQFIYFNLIMFRRDTGEIIHNSTSYYPGGGSLITWDEEIAGDYYIKITTLNCDYSIKVEEAY